MILWLVKSLVILIMVMEGWMDEGGVCKFLLKLLSVVDSCATIRTTVRYVR